MSETSVDRPWIGPLVYLAVSVGISIAILIPVSRMDRYKPIYPWTSDLPLFTRVRVTPIGEHHTFDYELDPIWLALHGYSPQEVRAARKQSRGSRARSDITIIRRITDSFDGMVVGTDMDSPGGEAYLIRVGAGVRVTTVYQEGFGIEVLPPVDAGEL